MILRVERSTALNAAVTFKRYGRSRHFMLGDSRNRLCAVDELGSMFRASGNIDRQVLRRIDTHTPAHCGGTQVAQCLWWCLASAALSSLLTCGAIRLRSKRNKSRKEYTKVCLKSAEEC